MSRAIEFGPPRVIGVRYDAQSSFRRGPAGAPPLIRAALHSSAGNLWSESGVDLGVAGSWSDGGDIEPGALPSTNARDVVGAIEGEVDRVVAAGHRPLILGGDHSITYPILRAIAKGFGPPTVLHIDAHSDTYDEFEGNRLSHACPFARIMEEGLASQLVQVGIRTLTGHQRDQTRRFGIEVIDMIAWAGGARPNLSGPLYISLDLDGIDPAFAPGVSHREPGGLSVREVIGLVQSAPIPIVGADLVEYNPDADVDGMTATVAAKLVKELLARMISGAR